MEKLTALRLMMAGQTGAPTMPTEFKAGDIVRLTTGTAPQKVVNVGHEYLVTRYLSDPHGHSYGQQRRKKDRYVHYDEPTETETETSNMPKLYQTKTASPEFGTFLANDSEGRIVLEMKGGGGVKAFKRDDIEEVRPYAVKVLRIGSSSTAHRISTKGALEAGDLVLSNSGNMYRVLAVDTKFGGKIGGPLNGRKVATEPLPTVEDPNSLNDEDYDDIS